MAVRQSVLAGLLAAVALAGCTRLENPEADVRAPGDAADVASDPGPVDPGPAEASPPDSGLSDEDAAADVAVDAPDEALPPDAAADVPAEADPDDPGAEDPGAPPVDPGSDPGTPVSGKVEVTPYTMDFGTVPSGTTSKRNLNIKNVGLGNLGVDAIRITGSTDFAPDLPGTPKVTGNAREWTVEPPRVLAKGEVWALPILYRPTIADKASAEVEVLTSDTDRPDGPPKSFLSANSEQACASFNPDRVDFGNVVVNQAATVPVQIKSCGGLPLEIRGVNVDAAGMAAGVTLDFTGLPGGVAPTAQVPVILPANQAAEIRVTWTPPVDPLQGTAPLDAQVALVGNQFSGSTFLPLAGTALPFACVQPRMLAVAESSVPACSLLTVSEEDSIPFTSDHPVTTYTWTADLPGGAAAAFIPDAGRKQVSLFAAAPGTYTFRLEAGDDAGNPSCGRAEQSVTVTQRLVAALVLTAARSDGLPVAPGAGPDLDLHVLHPSAPSGVSGWFDLAFDCSPSNPDPDKGTWGDPRETIEDRVAMVSQSVDGMLPEVVVLELGGCIQGKEFRFGTHYFEDNGLGDAVATLTAYVNGVVVMQSHVTLRPGELWDAGVLKCGRGAIPTTVREVPGPSIFTPAFGTAFTSLEPRR